MLCTDRVEFAKFYERLISNTPEGYTPWLFPVRQKDKAPDVKTSWKSEKARITREQADERLAQGLNVGISGRREDKLILVDIDDASIEYELKPTLKIRSRSRTGTHAIYWADPNDDDLPCNIPTDKGEVRSSDQYLVAPGSYVPITDDELAKKVENGEITEKEAQKVKNDPNRGLYTVDNDKQISKIKFKELPEVFRKKPEENKEKRKEIEKIKKNKEPFKSNRDKNHSALFDLEIEEIAPTGLSGRDSHPIHNSGTGTNWMVKNGLGHCWRHLVSLNAIQYLVVASGYMSCEEAGTAHSNTQGRGGSGPSYIIGDDRAIWEAWYYAKKQNIIPKDDRTPIRALWYLAKKHGFVKEENIDSDKMLPRHIYNKVISIAEEEY